jgi:hypothetical protein
VQKLFPEADQISSDRQLRRKVLDRWWEAWKLSRFEKVEQTPFPEEALAGINNVEHIRAVTALLIQFARTMEEFLGIPNWPT